MTYAIIETGGKQLRVETGRFYDIELLHNEPDEKVTISSVLLVQHNGEVTIGQPLVAGATVEGTVMRHLRDRKVLVYKMKPKKKTRKKRGHRQEITRLMIDSISFNGSVITSEEGGVASSEAPQEVPVVEALQEVAQELPQEEAPQEVSVAEALQEVAQELPQEEAPQEVPVVEALQEVAQELPQEEVAQEVSVAEAPQETLTETTAE
jgi:large subunit ribosomal protein L21